MITSVAASNVPSSQPGLKDRPHYGTSSLSQNIYDGDDTSLSARSLTHIKQRSRLNREAFADNDAGGEAAMLCASSPTALVNAPASLTLLVNPAGWRCVFDARITMQIDHPL